MDLFRKTFSRLLEQDKELQAPEAPVASPATDREAMAQKLDTAKPDDFDVRGNITNVDAVKAQQREKLKEWISKIDTFIEFLNGTNDGSVQSLLHSALCETMFQDIARSEKKKIARLAAELSSLSESFKGYLISSNE